MLFLRALLGEADVLVGQVVCLQSFPDILALATYPAPEELEAGPLFAAAEYFNGNLQVAHEIADELEIYFLDWRAMDGNGEIIPLIGEREPEVIEVGRRRGYP